MKYLIEMFRLTEPDSNAGRWHSTAWGGDDFEHTKEMAQKILDNNKQHIVKVRVLKVECEFSNWSKE